MPISKELLLQIKHNDPKLSELKIDDLEASEVASLFEAISHNNTIKKLTIKNLIGKLSNLYIQSIFLSLSETAITSFEIQSKMSDKQTERFVKGLPAIATLIDFKIPMESQQAEEVKKILQRNQQINIASHLILNQLLTTYSQQKKSEETLLDPFFAKLQQLYINNATHLEILNTLKSIREDDKFKQILSDPRFVAFDQHLASCENLINKMVKACLAANMTPLHAAAGKGLKEYILPLLLLGADINAVDHLGETPLYTAVTQQYPDIVKLLLENGADANIKNNSGMMPLHKAIASNDEELINLLKTHTKEQINIEKFLATRKLHYAFGVVKLHTKNMPQLKGGSLIESVNTLATILEKFIETKKNSLNDKQLLETIITNLKTTLSNSKLTPQQQYEKLIDTGMLLTITGFIGHLMGCYIEKTDKGNYKISMAERGFFSGSAPKDLNRPGKLASIWSIEIDSSHIAEIIRNLPEIKESDEKTAREFLFQKIPKLANSQWQYNMNLTQSPFKGGICFYGNTKTLLLNEFAKMYGEKAGYEKYKEFTLFLRKQILAEYKQVTEKEDPYIALCEAIIKEKEEKFEKRFGRKFEI